MRAIDQHAHPIHFLDDATAEVRKPLVVIMTATARKIDAVKIEQLA